MSWTYDSINIEQKEFINKLYPEANILLVINHRNEGNIKG